MKQGIFLIILIVVLILFTIYTVYNNTHILGNNLVSLYINTNDARSKKFQLIIDVRTEKEREELGYYPNSIPLSINKLDEIKSLTSNHTTSILVYSNGDNLARYAAEKIYALGYHNVQYITTTYLYLLPSSN